MSLCEEAFNFLSLPMKLLQKIYEKDTFLFYIFCVISLYCVILLYFIYYISFFSIIICKKRKDTFLVAKKNIFHSIVKVK